MHSPPSSSDQPPSSAFELLHPRLQKWIWKQNWTELRDIQEEAFRSILTSDKDVILSAATATGKTEAAFLPICSKLAQDKGDGGIRALCISPLKALINDQYRRLEDICKQVRIPIHRWHGDVSSSQKKALIKEPSGLLLITPESLEALFVAHGPKMTWLFSGLAFTVVDELHAFMGSERGMQLQSLLHRLELVLHRRIPRVALSATLGDMSLAAEFLRPRHGKEAHVVVSKEASQELQLIIRGYLVTKPDPDQEEDENAEISTGDVQAISEDLFRTLRGQDNLIFANTRRDVETFADILRRICEKDHLPNEFWPHHGSLSRDIRLEVEALLKKRERPISAVCTNTLELGIDIGSVSSVAQIGAPPSVSSMRQRLGRSGRRKGEPAVLRIYVREPEITKTSHVLDQLRLQLVQSIAMVNLLIQKWYEPPESGVLHLSTLVQQTLSLIAQHGGMAAAQAYLWLCEPGPFTAVDKSTFLSFLRALGDRELLEQAQDGTLLLGARGEKIVEHYTFFAAFATPEEYRIVTGSKTLGSLPILYPISPGMYLIFAGRRWQVVGVDGKKKVIEVKPAPGGRPPSFGGGTGALVHQRVREEMFRIYSSEQVPVFLDPTAKRLLEEAREAFKRFDLARTPVVASGEGAILIFWAGDKVINTIAVMLLAKGMKVFPHGPSINIPGCSPDDVRQYLGTILDKEAPTAASLAAAVKNKYHEKHDYVLTEELLSVEYGSRYLDIPEAMHFLQAILEKSRIP